MMNGYCPTCEKIWAARGANGYQGVTVHLSRGPPAAWERVTSKQTFRVMKDSDLLLTPHTTRPAISARVISHCL